MLLKVLSCLNHLKYGVSIQSSLANLLHGTDVVFSIYWHQELNKTTGFLFKTSIHNMTMANLNTKWHYSEKSQNLSTTDTENHKVQN